jgi:glucose/arabinose dehydrogenase
MGARGTRAAGVLIAALILAGCDGESDGDEESARASPAPQAERKQQGSPPPPPPPTGDGRGGVVLTRLGDFEEPVHVAQAPGSRELYVVEKGGTIRVIDAQGDVRGEPFLDISDQVSTGTEQGLFSIAFPPDDQSSGRFYIDYTDTAGDTRIVEYRRSADHPLQADESSARQVLFVDQPYENHNGGLLLFGPNGHLYVGLGDGGSADDPERNGQDLGTLLGKILRIDPQPSGGRPYSIVPGNRIEPGARPEIFAYGLRNPWRFSFDREEGSLWIGDVGQGGQEEIDVGHPETSGSNFGWSAFEGTERLNADQSAPDAIAPVHAYPLDGGNCSVTGGYVVRDRHLRSLYGRYLYGDYCAGQLRSFVPSGEGARGDRLLGVEVPLLTSFGEDSAGRIYATSQEGPVYRLDPR